MFEGVVMVLPGQADLLELIRALSASSRFARRLNGRQQQRDQNADDRNHDQQLDQSETDL
jgi:hypothetical protein